MFHDVPLFNDKEAWIINAVLEIPKGSKVKYEFNHELGVIMVDRIGKTPIGYTFNYGDLPQSWNSWDNDPLDVVILCQHELAVGTVVPCRVVWGLNMIDGGEDDYKVLAVADDKYYDHVKDIGDVHPKELEDIVYYMEHYKDLHGKVVTTDGWDPKEKALKRLDECHAEYKVKFGK